MTAAFVLCSLTAASAEVTPAGGASTFRSFEGAYGLGTIQAGVSWRLNAAIAVYLSGGYHLGDSVNLDEGGVESAIAIDPSGPAGSFGLAANF